jgi:phospholipid/cholesterol/gamma-HCH transport system substrate-binding protein
MSRSPVRDLLVGLFVLAGLAAIAVLSFSVGGLSYAGAGGLTIFAHFDQTGGLKARAPVEISGVKVGQVKAITLDDRFRAKVELDLDASLELPVDTTASIVTAGILGDRYVSLQLGGEEDTLQSGGEISFTESAVILERLIGQLIHGTDVEKSGKSEPGNGGGGNGGGSNGGTGSAKPANADDAG